MVLLTLTAAAKAAIDEYCTLPKDGKAAQDDGAAARLEALRHADLGTPIEHEDLLKISTRLTQKCRQDGEESIPKSWRLDSLLKGARVYQAPLPPKPEPTPEYKALMRRLRAEEEERQYERMINPTPTKDFFNQRSPATAYAFNPATSIGQGVGEHEADDVTYADVKRQVTLIINILVSIVACSVAIWVVARRWDAPQRLGLSMGGSGLVALAEVAIYMGYIRRIKEAKVTERKVVETKEVVETWVFDGSAASDSQAPTKENVRYRKGKHR